MEFVSNITNCFPVKGDCVLALLALVSNPRMTLAEFVVTNVIPNNSFVDSLLYIRYFTHFV